MKLIVTLQELLPSPRHPLFGPERHEIDEYGSVNKDGKGDVDGPAGEEIARGTVFGPCGHSY